MDPRRLLREPMLWFFVAGGALFAVAPRGERSDGAVHVSRRSLDALEAAEARRRHVTELPPAVAEAVRRQAIDDELLYREGLRLGVAENDNIIRQRVIEKMLFLAEDLGGGARPVDDGELGRYLAAHAGDFRRPPRVSFVHVFADDAGTLARIAPTLRPGGDDTPPAVGGAFPLGRRVVDAAPATLERSWGHDIAAAVAALPIGQWSAPLRSPYGWHLVKVTARSAGGLPALDEIRGAVRIAYLQERKARATAALLASVRARHPVVVDDRADAVSVAAGLGASVGGD